MSRSVWRACARLSRGNGASDQLPHKLFDLRSVPRRWSGPNTPRCRQGNRHLQRANAPLPGESRAPHDVKRRRPRERFREYGHWPEITAPLHTNYPDSILSELLRESPEDATLLGWVGVGDPHGHYVAARLRPLRGKGPRRILDRHSRPRLNFLSRGVIPFRASGPQQPPILSR